MEIEKKSNELWPPKYDQICMGSSCPVGSEALFGQEFYHSQIDSCKLVLCPICRFKEKECTVPNCKERFEKHNFKTQFNVQSKKLFTELDKEVQEQIKIREKIYEKYHVQIQDLKQSSKANKHSDDLAELLEDAIYFTIAQNKQQQIETDKKINQLWRSIESEDLSVNQRELPQRIEAPKYYQQTQNVNYSQYAGFNDKQFHISRIMAGF